MYLLDVDHVYILFCSDNMQEGHNYCIVFPLLLKAIYISVSIGPDRVLKHLKNKISTVSDHMEWGCTKSDFFSLFQKVKIKDGFKRNIF